MPARSSEKSIQIRNSQRGGLVLTMPTKKPRQLQVMLVVWLIGWGFGMLTGLDVLFGNTTPSLLKILAFLWLVFWLFAGGYVTFMLLWVLAGKEEVRVHRETLYIDKVVYNTGSKRTYAITRISNMRVRSDNEWDFYETDLYRKYWGKKGGRIEFTYGPTVVRLARSLSEAEGREFINALKQTDPFNETHFV